MNDFVDLTDKKNRIEGMQRMIRAIGLCTGNEALIIPITGVFDKTTENALKIIQCDCGLPEDGQYTYDVWKCLKEKYDKVISKNSNLGMICPYPAYNSYEIKDGERSELVLMTQLMLNALRIYYDLPYVPVNGIYGEDTARSVRKFQEANGLEANGKVDRNTWNKLAEEYNETVNDSQ